MSSGTRVSALTLSSIYAAVWHAIAIVPFVCFDGFGQSNDSRSISRLWPTHATSRATTVDRCLVGELDRACTAAADVGCVRGERAIDRGAAPRTHDDVELERCRCAGLLPARGCLHRATPHV